jgi:FdhD protein
MGRLTARRKVLRIDGQRVVSRPDTLAVEEPLEIRVGGSALTVTMRTPGDDMDLAAGFLVSEGVIARTDQLASMRYCAGATDEGVNTYNVLDLVLTVPAPEPRAFFTTSSCGICGTASLDAVRQTTSYDVTADPLRVTPALLSSLPGRLRDAQKVFDKTGGLHAAGLFSAAGDLLALR